MANDDCKWSVLLAGGLIVLAGWAAYSNSFHGPFVFKDDPGSIFHNLTIRHLWPLDTVLSPPCGGETVGGRPILNLSFAINYAFDGINVWWFHATNLIIHLLNSLLLLGILRRTFLQPALRPRFGRDALLLASTIALLWVVHPLTTEAVTYTVQRAESLASMFYLLVFYAVIRGVQSGRTILWFGIAVVANWLGVATKEIVVTAPVVVLCYDRTFLAGTFRQVWQQHWRLYLGLATAWLVMATLMLTIGGRANTAGFGHGVTSWEYAVTQGGVLLRYVRLALWPTGLCLNYGHPMATTFAEILPGVLFVLLLIGITGWAWKYWPGLGFLGFFFLAVLAPSSSFMPIVVEIVAEHRMYLPLTSVITLLVISAYLAGQKWIVRGRLVIGLCLVILVASVFGILTFQRNQDYRSEEAMWKSEARNPYNPAFHNSLGNALLEANCPTKAIEQYQEAVRRNPGYIEALNGLGIALIAQGQPEAAIEHFKQVVHLKPSYADAHYNWGSALSSLGRFAEAIEQYKKTLQLKPDHTEAQNNWGNACLSLGQPADAIPHFEQALRISPDYAPTHFNLVLALLHVGRIEEAIEHGRKAAKLMPDNSQVNQQVAWLLATHKEGNGEEAVKLALRACELTQRKDFVCLDTLAAAYAAAGQFDEAVVAAKEAGQLARAAGQNSAADEINRRLQLYRDRKPYRES